MKKVIKLTENDLIKIVKKVINEADSLDGMTKNKQKTIYDKIQSDINKTDNQKLLSKPQELSIDNNKPQVLDEPQNRPKQIKPKKTYQKNQGVKNLQDHLNKIGYKLTSDGIFGPKTKSAIIDFQQKNGLQPSGNPDPMTVKKILSLSKTLGANVGAKTPNIGSNLGQSNNTKSGVTLKDVSDIATGSAGWKTLKNFFQNNPKLDQKKFLTYLMNYKG